MTKKLILILSWKRETVLEAYVGDEETKMEKKKSWNQR